MEDDFSDGLVEHIMLLSQAQELLGERAFSLLQLFGKLMDGPGAGLYVSALHARDQLALVQRLLRGETLDIHLMHRHRSGDSESSSLAWRDGQLVMIFRDRQQDA